MKKIAVIYYSRTGNTEMMAEALAEGAGGEGAEVDLMEASRMGRKTAEGYDAFAFGCPAMGAEQLEEVEFLPVWKKHSSLVQGKPLALFGSCGWSDGTWLRNWEEEARALGALVCAPPLAVREEPGEEELEACRDLGRALRESL